MQPGQTMFVELLHVPRHLDDPAVQAGWIGGLGKFGVDRRTVLAPGHHQPGQILGKVPALQSVGEHPAELVHGFLDDRRKGDNSRHEPLSQHQGTCKAGEALPRQYTHAGLISATEGVEDRAGYRNEGGGRIGRGLRAAITFAESSGLDPISRKYPFCKSPVIRRT